MQRKSKKKIIVYYSPEKKNKRREFECDFRLAQLSDLILNNKVKPCRIFWKQYGCLIMTETNIKTDVVSIKNLIKKKKILVKV